MFLSVSKKVGEFKDMGAPRFELGSEAFLKENKFLTQSSNASCP